MLPQFIPEEAEKFMRAPAWKLAIVREMIPYMMTEDDKEVKELDDDWKSLILMFFKIKKSLYKF